MIGETVSHYRLLSQVGAGGMGIVYEAEDTRLGRRVAVKFLADEACCDPEAVARFMREARAISSLNHPHICTLHDIGQHDGRHYMVMELLEGESLKAHIDRGALPFDEVLDFGAQVADALDAAHAKGVVHRDIKPANLFLTKRGQLKVLDFGVAKLNEARAAEQSHLADTTLADHATTHGSAVGTVAYMSPEQARGQDLDARSDLFSAGVVLFEMATGRLPFPGATAATVFEGILTKPAPRPSQGRAGIPPDFDHVVYKALEKDRDTRYQGAAELRADLKRLRRDTGTSRTVAAPTAAAAPPVDTPPRAAKRRRGWLLVGTPLLALAIGGGIVLFRGTRTPALAARDAVVLASVVNRTGDAMFDDTLGEALGVQIRQSPFLSVVSDQQVQGTLRLMGRDVATVVTPTVGREVCQRLGARALISGTIASLGSAYLVTVGAQDCVSGGVLAEEQVQADSKEHVLAMLGTAVSAFRGRLGESLASIQRYDAKIEQATTSSLEALKAYGQGIRTRRTTGDFDAVPFFRRAIELDPEFALAYARLGTVYGNLKQTDESRAMTERAFALRDKVSEAERLNIEARHYSTVTHESEKAIETYRVLLATYPGDYTALVNIALLQSETGAPAEAVRSLEQAVRVAPDQPLGWLNLGETYMSAHRYDEARRALEAALKLQDSVPVRLNLFTIGIVTGDRALADAQVAAVRGRRDEVDLLGTRVQAAMYLGRLAEASSLADEWQQRMTQASRKPQIGEGVATLAISEALVGKADAARSRLRAAQQDNLLAPNTLDEQLVVSALLGDGRTARAIVDDAVEESADGDGSAFQKDQRARALHALAALADGKPADALATLGPVSFDASHSDVALLWSEAHRHLSHWDEAAKGFAWLDSKEANLGLNAMTAYVMASLARVQVALGQTAEARKTYERLFALWEDADEDLPLLVEARAEFSKLGS